MSDSCFLCDCRNISNILSSSTAVVAVLATIYGYYQHKQEEKAKMTAEYNERYRKDENINKVLEYLIGENLECTDEKANEDSAKIDSATINQREMFLRFIEEVKYLVDKDLIDEKEAYDLFGYYANVACELGTKFLDDLVISEPKSKNGKTNNWSTLHKFVESYKKHQK